MPGTTGGGGSLFATARGGMLGVFIGFVMSNYSSSNGKVTDDSSSSEVRRFLSERGERFESFDAEPYSLDDGEEEEDDRFLFTTSVTCIVLLLILLTIAFEVFKEGIEERSNKNTRPIIESLFGELTVLGFLSAITFVITKMGFFATLSTALFGEGEDDAILEIFEFVHYCLFFIMLAFVLQVLVLVKEAGQIEIEWLEMDRECRDKSLMESAATNRRAQFQRRNSYTSLLPGKRDVAAERRDDHILFSALREEFIHDRDVEHPFQPADETNSVSVEFNFGRYLSMCLGHTLAKTVEITPMVWAVFALLTIMIYLIDLAIGIDLVILGWIWLGLGWSFLLFNVYFERYLIKIRNAFVSPRVAKNEAQQHSSLNGSSVKNLVNETTRLVEDEESLCEDDLLVQDDGSECEKDFPEWCEVDMEKHMEQRSWLVNKVCGESTPNRHHTLFWFERKGPKVHMMILQINLVFTGVYTAMLILAFFPQMYQGNGILFLIYLLLSLLPISTFILSKKHLVATLSQVSCIGSFRKPQVISNVIREEKTARVVRAFIVLYKMHRAAQIDLRKPKKTRVHYSRSFNKLEIGEISKTFDAFDRDGSGAISTEEIGDIMAALGTPLNEVSLQKMISTLDANGDGEVSREEFLQWYADHMEDDGLTMKERAHFLFEIFDHDGSGEITIGEFKTTLDSFNVGFTVDEVGYIVRELDEDGNGEIGEEEFEQLLEKYYPKEMLYEAHNQLKK